MKIGYQIFIWLLVLMFAWFAALQYNDPDPYIWIPVYAYFAVLGAWTVLGKVHVLAYWIGILGVLAFAFFQLPEKWEGFGEEMYNENIERAREAVGLVICAVGGLIFLLYNRLYSRKK